MKKLIQKWLGIDICNNRIEYILDSNTEDFERLLYLEKYLGIEYKVEETKGYKKIK